LTTSRRDEVEDGQLASIHERNGYLASRAFNATPITVRVAGCPARDRFMRRKSGFVGFDHAVDDTGAIDEFGQRCGDERGTRRVRDVSGPLVRGTR